MNGFKDTGLFPPNIKELEHRIVLSQRATNQSDVPATSMNTRVLLESTKANSDADAKLPPC
ncbi:unnamed protein product [Larinioides sclopetarius]|uniref:Uncharacterized protein n=1 Tax=Larinioides sclopetarius TaxID=280406 RepID=A0AAV2BU03_9ARAC